MNPSWPSAAAFVVDTVLLLYFVVAGLLIGRIGGGRLSGITGIQFRWWALALAGLAFRVHRCLLPRSHPVWAMQVLLSMSSRRLRCSRRCCGIGPSGLRRDRFRRVPQPGGHRRQRRGMPSPPDVWLALNDVANLPTTTSATPCWPGRTRASHSSATSSSSPGRCPSRTSSPSAMSSSAWVPRPSWSG